jgi:hypothetical protein
VLVDRGSLDGEQEIPEVLAHALEFPDLDALGRQLAAQLTLDVIGYRIALTLKYLGLSQPVREAAWGSGGYGVLR